MAGQKLKTHKGTAKRIKITSTGKLMHGKAGKNHLIIKKGKSTRSDKSGRELHSSETAKIRNLLPYTS